MPLSPAEQLARSTVRIECDLAGGGVGTGTGFFYSLDRDGDQHVPVIVTNKHVVEGAVKGRFLLTLHNGNDGPAVGKFKPTNSIHLRVDGSPTPTTMLIFA